MATYGNECEICRKPIRKAAKRCKKHAQMLSGPIRKKLPSDSEILRMVAKSSQSKVAAELGVSVNTIKNIVLKYKK